MSQDLAAAMREWDVPGDSIEDSHPEFPEHCEFCHESNIREVFLVVNRENGNEAWIGRDCASRYTRQPGAVSEADNRVLIDQIIVGRRRMERIRRLVNMIQPGELFDSQEPLEELHGLLKAHYNLKDLNDLTPWMVPAGRYLQIMSEIYGGGRWEFIERTPRGQALLVALHDPGKLIKRKNLRPFKPLKPAGAFSNRRKRATTTLAKGEHTRPL
ncbi:MAG: hypothetical protein ACYCRD_04570 [Leptospirillum sp.]